VATAAELVISRAPGRAPDGYQPWSARATINLVPPAVYVVAGIVSAQVGASVAKSLFAALGPAATVSLRTAFAALVLLLVWRPRLHGRSRADLLAALALGVTFAGLSLSF
jgi:inner membrane transporter RhtA